MEEILKQILAEQRKTNELLGALIAKGIESEIASTEMRNKMVSEMAKQNPMVGAMLNKMGL